MVESWPTGGKAAPVCPYRVQGSDGSSWCWALGSEVTARLSAELPCADEHLEWSRCPAYRWARGESGVRSRRREGA